MPITINGSSGIVGANGSVTFPALTGADIDTGVFFPEANVVAFSTGSVESFRANANGIFATANVNVTNLTATNIIPSSSYLRNRIINGDMRISQRGTSFTTPASSTYTLDRWIVGWGGAAPASITQSGSLSTFKNTLGLTGAAGNTTVSIGQRIEALNCYDLIGNACTISCVIQSSTTQTFQWVLYYANSSDNFSAVTQISSGTWSATASTIHNFSATVSSGSMVSGVGNGIYLAILPANGGAYTSGTFYITGVQLEVGSVATPFERQIYSNQLAMCQRYFERSYEQGTATGAVTTNGAAQLPIGASASYFQGIVPYVEKRAQPTLTIYDCAGNASRVTGISAGGAGQTDNNNVISTTSPGQRGGWLRIAALAGGTAVYHWVASAEL